MTIETILVKRRALYQGEVGLFPTTQMAEDDLAAATMNEEVIVTFKRPRTLEQLKFLWALVHKVSDNSNRWLDKDEAMLELKLRTGFTKLVWNPKTEELELRAKSLTRLSSEQLRLLTDKMINVICKEIMPGMAANDLRWEIEEMIKLRA